MQSATPSILRRKIILSENYAELKRKVIEFIDNTEPCLILYDEVFNPETNPKWNKLLRQVIRRVKNKNLEWRDVVLHENGFEITYSQW